jgi:uncharacterized membrane protein YeaQ/YmgE (transglycosylase-associated protein family)
MDLLWIIILTLLLGLVAGLLARAIVPGKDAMGLLPTALLGIVGSFVGGAIWALFSKEAKVFAWPPATGGLILSVVGAVIALLIYNRFVAKKA